MAQRTASRMAVLLQLLCILAMHLGQLSDTCFHALKEVFGVLGGSSVNWSASLNSCHCCSASLRLGQQLLGRTSGLHFFLHSLRNSLPESVCDDSFAVRAFFSQ